MRKLMLIGAALVTGTIGLNHTLAQQVQQPSDQQSADEGRKVTGMVTQADQQTREFTIENQKFKMPEEGGGAALFPQVGAEVTLFYRQEDGQKVVTRIGQAEE